MTERRDDPNVSVDTRLAATGVCAQIHLPSGQVCGLPHRHPGSCRFQAALDIVDAQEFPPRRRASDHEARGGRGESARGAAHAARRELVSRVHWVDSGGAG
jgi:hypothetical protein